ncbi:sugar ABC transporter substrate-binding protein [Agaricicola taiwanensis]|uniref:Sugar ABC transporter substrate-binding protein n=1 Tax=Agaricicola taiwanensis TaxID=591372 RepID=A0A8J3DXR5_9RHOB|nr:polysaccharide biosynthesis/export family protein [Agaricicola taiwanensis]GGE48781.1 sugar ABC transporter substrate-binding protein [Agaricicola taiwanensis]
MGLTRAALMMGCLALTGCAAMPSQGPTARAFGTGTDARATVPVNQQQQGRNYAYIELNEAVLAHLATSPGHGAFGSFSDRGGPTEVLIGPGDQVKITIFEAGSGGLFIPGTAGSRPGNFVDLPAQTVSRSGEISVPFAGQIRAAGRTPAAVGQDIQQRLANRAIEPQVLVTISEQRGNQVSVLGDVNLPGRFPLNASGQRLLDAIAQAGGPKSPDYETYVTLQRNGRDVKVAFDTIVENPRNNIFLRSSDVVYVSREPKTFVVLGAAGENGLYNFEGKDMSLADAVGKAGGLLDARANPTGVYLYRREPISLLAQMGVDTSRFIGTPIPTIYHINLRKPGGLFLARDFRLADGDAIFITNTETTQLGKVLQLFRLGTGAVRDLSTVRSDFDDDD